MSDDCRTEFCVIVFEDILCDNEDTNEGKFEKLFNKSFNELNANIRVLQMSGLNLTFFKLTVRKI